MSNSCIFVKVSSRPWASIDFFIYRFYFYNTKIIQFILRRVLINMYSFEITSQLNCDLVATHHLFKHFNV